jgi:DNA-directed RNA polymerase omega subunit
MAISKHPPENKFAYVVLAALRARQFQSGARPLLETSKSTKATRIAQEELDKAVLEYQTPDLEEEVEESGGKRRKG